MAPRGVLSSKIAKIQDKLAVVFTQKTWFHALIIFLILLDVGIVFGELIVDLEVIRSNECHSSHDCPHSVVNRTNESDPHSWTCSFEAKKTECVYLGGKHRCAEEGTHHDLNPEEVLHIAGLVVLGIFVGEVVLKVFAFGRTFLHHKLEVFDAVVVIISFVLDLTINTEEGMAGVGLIILLRLWRFARIFNGITVIVEDMQKRKKRKWEVSCRACQSEKDIMNGTIRSLQTDLGKERKQVEDLQEKVDNLTKQIELLSQTSSSSSGDSCQKKISLSMNSEDVSADFSTKDIDDRSIVARPDEHQADVDHHANGENHNGLEHHIDYV